MGAPTRLPNGVTNVSKENPLGMLGMMDPTKFHVWWDDFNDYVAANWTVTASGTSPVTLLDADGGLLRITTGTSENEGDFLEWDSEIFLIETGKKTWIKTRFRVGDAIQSDLMIGLHSTDTTPLDATLRFAFISEDGSASLFFNVDDNSTDADSDSVATLTDDAYFTVPAYYDGNCSIELYLNDALVTTMTGVDVPGAELAVGFGYLNGASGAETTDFDYILVIKER